MMINLFKTSLYFVLLSAMIFASCENYDLAGDKTIFIGNWQWVYSVGRYVDIGDGHHIYFTSTPSSESNSFSIEFRDNGKYLLKENGDIIHRERAKFTSWYFDTNGKYYFCIDINVDYDLQGYIWGDSLLLLQHNSPFYFPALDEKDLNSLSYTSYFVRE